MSKKKTFHLYRINWTDASSQSRWRNLNDIDTTPYKVASVGWFIKEDKDFLYIAQNMASQYQASDVMQIPKRWIDKKKKITKHVLTYSNE